MRQLGAYRVADDHRDSLLVLHVPPSIARDLARQAWVKGIEIDSSDARPASEVVPWGTDSVNAPLLHAEGLTGAGVRIGILDGGIDCNAPDLAGRVVGGHDFIANNATYCHNHGAPANHHGTRVAHIIGARWNAEGIRPMLCTTPSTGPFPTASMC